MHTLNMTYQEYRDDGKIFDITPTSYLVFEGAKGKLHYMKLKEISEWVREDFKSDHDFLAAVWEDLLKSKKAHLLTIDAGVEKSNL